ncbi:hypothetical protein MIND_01158200 [Mycena indigotica]|uniref:lytic cellulose monooxygenase (C4-dehydrogenating) n=1 Tax=Mycena indigotica TaxID=2126181 RepID=A0A8H6S4H8_9AGAR|nr:uncharacterized protein MIND_01158200 [Mycena indigotica]KAF7292603.1 hypothetical protein MIND_01158200 [Mycena indigotica]
MGFAVPTPASESGLDIRSPCPGSDWSRLIAASRTVKQPPFRNGIPLLADMRTSTTFCADSDGVSRSTPPAGIRPCPTRNTTRTVLDHCLARGNLDRVRALLMALRRVCAAGRQTSPPYLQRSRDSVGPLSFAGRVRGVTETLRRPVAGEPPGGFDGTLVEPPEACEPLDYQRAPTVLPTVADWGNGVVGSGDGTAHVLSRGGGGGRTHTHARTSRRVYAPLNRSLARLTKPALLSPHLPPFRLASASCPVTPSSRPPINSVLVTFTLVSSVLTHGWIGSVSVNVGGAKKLFKGNEPTEELPNAASSAIRQQPPLATVAAGSKLDVFWQTLTGSGFWFHDVGPMMAYMADCGGNCAQFDASKAKWFKIQEQGMDASGKWAQANLDNGSPATVTIPANLKAGNYLLRHEIIALHTAQSQGGAEFYPGCVQLSVTGAGKGVPSDSETVKLPGAYKPTDAGILIDVYNMKGAYKFPGPAVASFIGGGSPAPAQGGSDDNTTEKPSSPATTKKSTSPPASSTTKKASSPASSTTSVASAVPTKSGSASCRAKRSHHRRQEVVDVREEVRRSRVRHMHRAGVARSF